MKTEKWVVIDSGGRVMLKAVGEPQIICTLETRPLKITREIGARAHLIAATPELLEACRHGAMSIHHPSCSHGKSGDGNTCNCHVGKCQEAIAKADND